MRGAAVVIVLVGFTVGRAWAEHDTEGKASSYKVREVAPEAVTSSLSKDAFKPCPQKEKEREGKSFAGVHIFWGLVKEKTQGFVAALPGSTAAKCAALVVNESGKVLGKVEARVGRNNLFHYTIAPGELFNKLAGLFMVMPDADPSKPLIEAPANCEVQMTQPPKLAITETNGRETVITLKDLGNKVPNDDAKSQDS